MKLMKGKSKDTRYYQIHEIHKIKQQTDSNIFCFPHHAQVLQTMRYQTTHKAMIMEWFFCIANMILDSELLLIIILLFIIF